MPALRNKALSIYVRPWLADALEKTANVWGCSVSDAVGVLLRWGARGLAIEARVQGREVPGLDDLDQALAIGMALWGPLTPTQTTEVASTRARVDAELARAERQEMADSRLLDAIKQAIREMKQDGEL